MDVERSTFCESVLVIAHSGPAERDPANHRPRGRPPAVTRRTTVSKMLRLAPVLLLLLTQKARGLTITVAPGDSLRAAQAAARTAAAQHGGATIELQKGVHALADGPLVLGAADSRVAWRGLPGAVISGGTPLAAADFAPVPAADPVYARLPAAVRSRVLRADVSARAAAYGAPGCRMAGGGPMELYRTDGAPLTAARWPNVADPAYVDGWASTLAGNATGFALPPTVPLPANSSGTIAHGYWHIDYLDASIPLEALTAPVGGRAFASVSNATLIKLGQKCFYANTRFFLLNQPEFQDEPSEYWIDSATGFLYLLPDAAAAAGSSYVLGVQATLFELTGTSTSISFSGISMIAAKATAIQCGGYPLAVNFCKAKNVSITNCSFTGFGNGAVELETDTLSNSSRLSEGWTIDGVRVAHVNKAIYMSGGDLNTLRPSGHVIANTTVTDYGRTCYGFTTAVEISGVGTKVIANELAFGNGQAILWAGSNHLIARNVIHDTCRNTVSGPLCEFL